MINAKKSILSLWKGMKERLSAILKKRRKESGKNCQNTAAERKSISSVQPAETAGKDAEILAAIDAIEFDFGPDRFTTAQAELLFTYETGLDIDQIYVIALSKNCGTVIFYIPDDLTVRIMERAAELHCTAGKYLADLVEFRWAAEPAAELARVEPEPVNEVVAALPGAAILAAEIDSETVERIWNAVHEAVRILWDAVQAALPEILQAIEQAEESGHPERKSNNWLKMHGFPMRRKGKGRKHHE